MSESLGDDALSDFPVTPSDDVPTDEGDVGTVDATQADGEDNLVRGFASSALTPQQRQTAQAVVVRACRLLLENAADVHYTEGPQRWQGIDDKLYVRDGRYPSYGDCSSTATWILWNALFVHLGLRDVVNGAGWNSGYTGTMLQHGGAVREGSAQVGDLVIYGPAAPGKHVAVCLGGGMVFSHGSEAGPFKLALRYRSDVLDIRRYF